MGREEVTNNLPFDKVILFKSKNKKNLHHKSL